MACQTEKICLSILDAAFAKTDKIRFDELIEKFYQEVMPDRQCCVILLYKYASDKLFFIDKPENHSVGVVSAPAEPPLGQADGDKSTQSFSKTLSHHSKSSELSIKSPEVTNDFGDHKSTPEKLIELAENLDVISASVSHSSLPEVNFNIANQSVLLEQHLKSKDLSEKNIDQGQLNLDRFVDAAHEEDSEPEVINEHTTNSEADVQDKHLLAEKPTEVTEDLDSIPTLVGHQTGDSPDHDFESVDIITKRADDNSGRIENQSTDKNNSEKESIELQEVLLYRKLSKKKFINRIKKVLDIPIPLMQHEIELIYNSALIDSQPKNYNFLQQIG